MVGVLQDQGNNPYPVAATGLLLGSQFTLVLYGLHLCQISRYYARFARTDKKMYSRVLVPTVFTLSSVHIGMIVFSTHHYLIQGIRHPNIWDTFYGGLSGQDFIIPMMSWVSHLFFGHRIYILRDLKKKWWVLYVGFASLTCAIGIAFAALARVWSMHPFQPEEDFRAMDIGPVANSFPTAWLSSAALIDGGLTASLLFILLRERHVYGRTKRILVEIAGLTLETVLLTHVVGATLFVLWLSSRTRTNAFWFFIEIIAELYALSILFTLNSRSRFRKAAQPDTAQMMDRQLNRLNNIDEQSIPYAYPPSGVTNKENNTASPKIVPMPSLPSTNTADIEKQQESMRTTPSSSSHDDQNKGLSSGSSAAETPEQGFLPTLPAEEHPKGGEPSAKDKHNRLLPLPKTFM